MLRDQQELEKSRLIPHSPMFVELTPYKSNFIQKLSYTLMR